MIKSTLWKEFYLSFLNYKSTGMRIRNYVVTIFKYEVIKDISVFVKNSIITGFNY